MPFVLVDPKGDKVPNVVLALRSPGQVPAADAQVGRARLQRERAGDPLPERRQRLGLSLWAARGASRLIVRLHYADGTVEDHPLENGVHFADYIRVVDVPGSKLAFKLGEQQIRYFSVEPKRKDPIERIELVKGPDRSAPVVMAVTVEVADAE